LIKESEIILDENGENDQFVMPNVDEIDFGVRLVSTDDGDDDDL